MARGRRGIAIAVALMGMAAVVQARPATPPSAAAAQPADRWLFTSFRGDGDGLHLATSSDGGRTWTDLNRTFLTPTVGSKLLRDPHILRGPDGVYRMVWTTGWKDTGFGYASSTDLVHWSDQRYVPVMADVPGTENVWAPETFYDAGSGRYVITWSSDVAGRFPGTVTAGRMNNRTYYVTTRDFATFSPPALFLDPGFDHIDTTVQKIGRRYIAVFKAGDNQQTHRWGAIHWAVADRALGPYRLMPTPLVGGERAEGPTLAVDGGTTRLYVDHYADGRYGAYETRDWKRWTDVSRDVQVVKGQRHGTVLKVPGAVVQALERAG